MTVYDLIRRGLFGDRPHHGVALVPHLSSDPARHEGHELEYGFVEEVVQEGQTCRLPAINAAYPQGVRKIVSDEKADRFYVVPPFGPTRRLSDEVRGPLRDEFGHADLATITLLSVLRALDREDKAAFTLPTVFFGSWRTRRHREESLSMAHPELIIRSEERLFVDSVAQVQTIVYAGHPTTGEQTPVTKFFSVPAPSKAKEEEVTDDFEQLLRQDGGETEYGFVIRDTIDSSEAWTFDAYNPEIGKEIDELKALGDVIPLGELYEVMRGVKISDIGDDESPRAEASSATEQISIVEQTDIRRDGTIVVEDAERVELLQPDQNLKISGLRGGDICVRQFIGEQQGIVAGRVYGDHPGTTVSSRVLLLRPKEKTTLEDTEVVLQYLQSDRAARYLISKHIGGTRRAGRLLKSSLRDLPVPVVDADLKEALRSLTEAADMFEKWKGEALGAARSLFDFSSAKDGKMHLLSTGRRTRQRLQAAKRQDDLSFRVQTQFPHPVAYRWRTVAAAKPDLEGYLHVLECAEVLTCYLALVAITMARHIDKEIGYLEVLGARVADGRGTNLGDWIAILREVRDSKSFRHLPDDTPFYEVMHFMPRGEYADEALSSLKLRRDKQAHGKGPRGDAVEPAFEEAKEDLLNLLEAAEFLSEYPLRYIDRTKADTIQDRLTYWYRDVMGDHPLVPVECEATEPKTLEAESLYLVDRSGTLHLLRPLLDRRRCPVCGTWSTFYLDSYQDDDHACVMKSMEHSHTTSDEDIYEAFQKIGLLP